MKKILVLGAGAIVIAVCATAWLNASGPAPTIDAVGATPSYVAINAPTDVLFTATITNPNVQPGVNLLKVDASGKTLSTIGAMNDRGVSGDQVAGDGRFSLKISVNEPSAGQVYYRVSAPFKGTLRRALSSPLTTVTAWLPISDTSTHISLLYPPTLFRVSPSLGHAVFQLQSADGNVAIGELSDSVPASSIVSDGFVITVSVDQSSGLNFNVGQWLSETFGVVDVAREVNINDVIVSGVHSYVVTFTDGIQSDKPFYVIPRRDDVVIVAYNSTYSQATVDEQNGLSMLQRIIATMSID